MDRGANGGIAGMETLILERYDDYVDCRGMANHTVSNLELVKGAVVTRSIGKGDIILAHHYAADMPDVRTIFSAGQMEAG